MTRYAKARLAEIEAATRQAMDGPPQSSTLGIVRPPISDAERARTRDRMRRWRRTPSGRKQAASANCSASHGLTLEEYRELFERQRGRCAICDVAVVMGYDLERPIDGRRGPRRGQGRVDHDRACCPGRKACGRCVRGILCSACAAAIANFRDNPELLLRAAKYVTRS